MSPWFVRPLLLVCSFALLLPSGWCCLLPVSIVRAATAQPASACCCGKTQAADRPATNCCCKTHGTAPRDQSTPQVKACCCTTPLSVPPAKLAPCPPELTALLPLAVVDGLDTSEIAGGEASTFHPPPSRPLQLLQCVWRC